MNGTIVMKILIYNKGDKNNPNFSANENKLNIVIMKTPSLSNKVFSIFMYSFNTVYFTSSVASDNVPPCAHTHTHDQKPSNRKTQRRMILSTYI